MSNEYSKKWLVLLTKWVDRINEEVKYDMDFRTEVMKLMKMTKDLMEEE